MGGRVGTQADFTNGGNVALPHHAVISSNLIATASA
jgi:hypothetical protein